MRAFEYCEPATLEQAVALLDEADGQACLMAGGTDLLVQLKAQVRHPQRVVSLRKVAGLGELRFDDSQGLTLGAQVTVRQVETDARVQRHYPNLARACTDFASIQVRNRATVVGNVCRASPSADALPALIADHAQLDIVGLHGARTLALDGLCTAPGKTVLAGTDIVTGIRIPAPPPSTGKAYLKYGRRAQMELATVGVAVTLGVAQGRCTAARIVLAAVAPTPLRAWRAEALLLGSALDDSTLRACAQAAAADCHPISDVRASADYRREMVSVLTRRAIEQASRNLR